MAGRVVTRIILFITLCLPVICGCTGRKKVPEPENPLMVQTCNVTYLFNGESLDGWEITNFGPQGPVFASGNTIVLGMGDGCTGITWKGEFPEMNYEVSLDAKRVDGNDFFCGLTFPVGKDPCTLIIGGWGGAVVGLSSVNGLDASENETTSLRSFEKERWYNIRLRVTDVDITAWIDEEVAVNLVIDGKKLSVRPEVELSRPFGIASWKTTAAVKNIMMKKL